jgi:hypothetical protein
MFKIFSLAANYGGASSDSLLSNSSKDVSAPHEQMQPVRI